MTWKGIFVRKIIKVDFGWLSTHGLSMYISGKGTPTSSHVPAPPLPLFLSSTHKGRGNGPSPGYLEASFTNGPLPRVEKPQASI